MICIKERLSISIYEICTSINNINFNNNYENNILILLKDSRQESIDYINKLLSSKKGTIYIMSKIDTTLNYSTFGEIEDLTYAYYDKCPLSTSKGIVVEIPGEEYKKYWNIFVKLKEIEKYLFSFYKENF